MFLVPDLEVYDGAFPVTWCVLPDAGLTSGISWTLVVDRLSGRGTLPGHCEVFLLTNLVRSLKKEKRQKCKEAKLGSDRKTETYQHAALPRREEGPRNEIQINDLALDLSPFSVHLLFIPLPLFIPLSPSLSFKTQMGGGAF